MFLAAVVQLSCTADVDANWEIARGLIERAAGYGARLVATPENTNFLGPPDEKVRRAESLEGQTCERFAGLAREAGIHLLLGSFNERSEDPARCYNTSVLFGPDGTRLTSYRKIHLFDVDVSNKVRFSESTTIKPGDTPVVADTPLGRIGPGPRSSPSPLPSPSPPAKTTGTRCSGRGPSKPSAMCWPRPNPGLTTTRGCGRATAAP
jgi:predicted amidohydrolase